MNIAYCREHDPKVVLAIYACTLPMSHGVDEHKDVGILTVDDDPPTQNETSEQYSARIQNTYQAQFT